MENYSQIKGGGTKNNMKKLKIAMILAFSAALSVGALTACAPSNEYTIERIRFSGGDSITLTDANAATEESGKAAFDEAVKGLTLRVYADQSRNFISGEDCEYDTSAIVWGTVGSYTATATPTANNPNKLSIQLTVNIDHDFGEPDASGVATCKHCGVSEATTTFAEPVALNYGAFHNGFSSDSTSDPNGLIKAFGSVDVNGAQTEVPTYSVGKLRKGMTLSVTGTAKSTATSEVWYYPVLGIAMREYDAASMQSPYSTAAYSGGASMLIRNDGWLLLNGIGNNIRLLAGFAGGTGEGENYGTLPGSVNENAPDEYDPNVMPSSAAEWNNWWVYSTGTALYTADYAEAQNVTFTWQFRDDNIIVVTNENNTTGTSITSYIRVPDSMGDYTFDTVLHGEYVNMTLNSISAIEFDRLSSVTAQFAGDAKRSYVEGLPMQIDDLSVRVAYESAPEAYEYTTDYTVQVYTGNAGNELTDEQKNSMDWLDITEDMPLQSTYKFFRVRVIVGGTARYSYLTVGNSNFITEIAPNLIDDIEAAKIVHEGNVYFNAIENTVSYGDLIYGTGTKDGTVVAVKPSGVPDRIPAAYGVADYTHFVALRLYAKEGVRFGNPSVGDQKNAVVNRAADGSYVDVLVFISTDSLADGVVINGLQTTPVYIDLSGLTLSDVSSVVEGTSADGTLPINVGGDVTITYTIPGLTVESANSNRSFAAIGIGAGSYDLSSYDIAWDDTQNEEGATVLGTTFRHRYGIDIGGTTVSVNGSIEDGENGLILKVTYGVPAIGALTSTSDGYLAFRLTRNGVALTDTVYYGDPVESEDAEGVIVTIDGVKVWLNARETTVYYAVIGTGDGFKDVTDSMVDIPSFILNVNAGEATPENLFTSLNVGVGLGMENGQIIYKDSSAQSNPGFTGMLRVFGEANNDRDVDRGWLVTGALSATVYGVESSYDGYTYYFELIVDGDSRVYKVVYTPADSTENIQASTSVEEISPEETEKVSLVDTSSEDYDPCAVTGVKGYAITEGTGDDAHIVFYYGVSIEPSHVWEAVKDNHYLFRCAECGAILNSTTVEAKSAGGTSPAGGTTISAEMLAGADADNPVDITKTGITASFVINSAESAWENNAFATVAGNIAITLPYLQSNVKSSKPEGVDEALWTKVTTGGSEGNGMNFFPSNAGTITDGYEETVFTATKNGYATVVVDPGTAETDGVRFYLDGVLVLEYKATAEAEGITVAEFVDLFLQCAKVSGVVVNSAKTGTALTTDDLIFELKALTAEQVATRYGNYTNEKDVYPDNHTFVTDKDKDDYGFCSVCGTMDPNHEHVYDQGRCIVCGQIDPSHTEHTFDENGECSCGARRYTMTADGKNYEGVAEVRRDFVNNDTSWTWWNGSTSNVAVSGDFVAIIEWDNVNDPNFGYDAVLQMDDRNGKFLNIDVMSGTDAGNTPAVAWGALLRTDNDNTSAPIADGKTMKQEAQGTRPSAWGGHYVCTITRIGGTITVVTEYTATKATDVTFTNTVIMTGMTTAELDVRISGNPAPLSNFEAWSGTLSAAN